MNAIVERVKTLLGPEMTGPGLAFLAVVLVFGIASPQFLSAATFGSVAFQLPELGLLTLAMLLPILTGGLNLAITFTANIAGLTDRGSILDSDVAFFDRMFAVNVRAPFFLMQGALKLMERGKRGGAIVNITSVNAYVGAPNLSPYSACRDTGGSVEVQAASARASRSARTRRAAISARMRRISTARKKQR